LAVLANVKRPTMANPKLRDLLIFIPFPASNETEQTMTGNMPVTSGRLIAAR